MVDHLQKALAAIERRHRERGLNPTKNARPPQAAIPADTIHKTCGKIRNNLNQLQKDRASYTLIQDLGQLSKAIEAIRSTEGPVAFDVETYPRDETARGLDPRRGRVGAISLAVVGRSFVLDVKKFETSEVRDALYDILLDRSLVAHNAPFDLGFLRSNFFYFHNAPVYDTLILDAALFYATGPRTDKDGWKGFTSKDKDHGYKRSLKEVVRDRLGEELDKAGQLEDWGAELSDSMVSYAAKDAELLLPLKDKLVSELAEFDMSDIVELEARFTPAMSYCMSNGFALDVEGWRRHAAETREERPSWRLAEPVTRPVRLTRMTEPGIGIPPLR